MALAVLGSLAAPAAINTARAGELTPAQKQEVRQHYEKASRAYDVQKFQEAIEEYQKTYEISGDAAMLFNVAQAYRLNGQPQEAIYYYRRYLERSPTASNRAATEQKIAELEKAIADAKGGSPGGTAPPPAAPPPPGAAPSVGTNAGVAAGGASTSTTPAPATFPPPQLVTVEEDSHHGRRVASLVLLGVGGAGLLTAAITGKLAANKGDNLTYASSLKGTFDPATERDGKRLDAVAVVSVIVGAAATVAGGVLFFLSRPSSGDEPPPATASRLPTVAPWLEARTLGASAVLSF
jgi:tetratricopeptide (TPR) repeat protein